MTNNYILVSTDTENSHGRIVASTEIANFRINEASWPIYSNTRNRKTMCQGDRLLIYCGGQKSGSRRVIACAKIGAISEVRRPRETPELKNFLSNSPHLMIEMDDIIHFKYPVHIRSILENLEMCPKNMSKWGVIFFGGVRKISNSDFDTIFRHGMQA